MIRRYVCGCYNCTDTLADDGEWVLHSDHAAEVAALTAEVESLRDVAREQHEWEEMAEWLGLPMKPDGCKKELESIIAVRDLLRAECEAWRAWWDAELPIDLNKPDMYQDVACARQDTDAAGILKGAGT